MKKFKPVIIALFILSFSQVLLGQMGTLEAVDGISLGNTSSTDNGLIRYTGSDFEGRTGGVWKSLTESLPWLMDGSDTYFDQGRVGIGNDNPSVELHVTGAHEMLRLNGTSPWLSLRETGQTNYGYYWLSGGHLNVGVTDDKVIKFKTNGSERMRINGSGDIGIGTNSPQVPLHINSNLESIRMDGSTPYLTFYNGNNYMAYLYHTGTDYFLANKKNGSLYFLTDDSYKMSIKSSGDVGIGTTQPNAKLDVRGSAIFNNSGSDADFRIESDEETHMFFVDAGNDRIGIGTDTPASALDVAGRFHIYDSYIETAGSDHLRISGGIKPASNGADDLGGPVSRWKDVWASNGTIQTSDKRLKKDVQALDYGLKEIMQLKPVRFKWNYGFDDSFKLGLIAQDLKDVVGEVVKTHYYEESADGASAEKKEVDRMGVYYSDLIPVLINAIKEQQNQIGLLETELENIKARLE